MLFALRTPAIQSLIVDRVAEWLSDELNTVVSVDGVDIEFFYKVQVKGLYVEDLHGDTLIYVPEVLGKINVFSLKSDRLLFQDIEFSNGLVHIQKHKDEPGSNIDFLVNYFNGSQQSKKQSQSFEFDPGEVNLSDFRFYYSNHPMRDFGEEINFDSIRVNNLFITITDFTPTKDYIKATIEHISLQEQSGFQVKYFESLITFTSTSIEFVDLLINTNESDLNCNLKFTYKKFTDFNTFVSDVKFNSTFLKSRLSSKDLAYFSPNLKGMDRTINFSGDINGTVDQLKAKDLNLEYGKATNFFGDINISGLPDINESFIDLVVNNLVLNKVDAETFPVQPYGTKKYLQLPEALEKLGNISFSGKFTGFITDFVAYGNLKSDLGNLSSDLNLKISEDHSKSSYKGRLSAFDFNIGALLNNEKVFGRSSFNAEVSGIGLDISSASASMDGTINYLEVLSYKYNNVLVDGKFDTEMFNGEFSVLDSNLILDFSGLIDFSNETPYYQFSTCIDQAKLAKLNIIDRDTSSTLTLDAVLSVKGDEIHELSGNIDFFNVYYTEQGKELYIDAIQYEADKGGISKSGSITSPLFDFSINGVYNSYDLVPIFDKYLNMYLPIYSSDLNREITDSTNFSYSILLKETEDLFNMFNPDLIVSEGTTISGGFNFEDEQLSMILNSESISYKSTVFNNIYVDSYTQDNKILIENRIGQMIISDTTKINNIIIQANTDKEISDVYLSAAAPDSMKTKMMVYGRTSYTGDSIVVFKVLDSDITLDWKKWLIKPLNEIKFTTGSIVISNWELSNGNEKIFVDGIISKNEDDVLNVEFDEFELIRFNPILNLINLKLSGTADGKTKIASLLSTPGIDSDLEVRTLAINNDTLGDAFLQVEYDTEKKVVEVNSVINKGGEKNILVKGNYTIGNENDQLDFDIDLEKTELKTFAKYVSGIFSDVRGLARGKLKLSGTSKKPVLLGELRLQKASFIVDYLQTRYSIADMVYFTEDAIEFRKVKVNDMYGNVAFLSGAIRHKNLNNLSLDFVINANKFQMLNTTIKDNELFYGEAYGTGRITMNGPFSMITMAMTLKTDRNTIINIPLSNPNEISGSSFINFVNHDTLLSKPPVKKIESTGFNITIDLEATNDAEVQLIFDSKIGDIMEGRGSGDIRLYISQYGEFNIQGNYIINSGNYLFTLQNVINKKFTIADGGIIQWSGDPYKAIVNLQGKYKLKANLYDLLQDTAYKDRIPVEVMLNIKEDLFNPEISFDIEVPGSDPLTDALVDRYINSEQEVNKQTMSLLVLGRFSKSDDVEFLGTSTNSVSSNASELLSQQLSVWGSQISDDIDIGFNYRAGDAFSQEELEIMLSTQIFNDRVSIDGNFGVAGNSSNPDNKNTSDIIGDFNVEVKVSKDGRFRFKAFNRTVSNTITNSYNSPYTQGLGVFYRQDFNTISELFRKSQKKRSSANKAADGAMK